MGMVSHGLARAGTKISRVTKGVFGEAETMRFWFWASRVSCRVQPCLTGKPMSRCAVSYLEKKSRKNRVTSISRSTVARASK